MADKLMYISNDDKQNYNLKTPDIQRSRSISTKLVNFKTWISFISLYETNLGNL